MISQGLFIGSWKCLWNVIELSRTWGSRFLIDIDDFPLPPKEAPLPFFQEGVLKGDAVSIPKMSLEEQSHHFCWVDL